MTLLNELLGAQHLTVSPTHDSLGNTLSLWEHPVTRGLFKSERLRNGNAPENGFSDAALRGPG